MKKIFTLGLGILMLASCSSDDSGSSIDNSKLTDKKWYSVSATVLGQTFPVENDYPNCERDYIMFKTGGVFETSYHTEDCQEFTENGAWVLDGKTITTNEDGDITNAVIKKLTNTQLEVTTQEDFNQDGEMETITLRLTTSN